MKKFVSVFLVCCLCISCFAFFTGAEPTEALELSLAPTDDPNVFAVSVLNNPGFMYLKLVPVINTEDVILSEVKNGTVSKDGFTVGSSGAIQWDSASDTKKTGVLFTLRLTKTKTEKSCNQTVSFTVKGCYNYDEQNVNVSFSGQTVTLPHTWDEGKVTREPQVGVKGEKTFTCIACKATKTEEIDALPAPAQKIGDIDGDKKVTASDARLALRCAVGLEIFKPEQIVAADINKNGKVEADDARMILRGAVGLEDTSRW